MCTFIPGEAIAIGPISALQEMGNRLPGVLSPITPFASEVYDLPADSEFSRLGSVTLKTDPGLELYAVSQMSARLAGAIERGDAAVDLNQILPVAAVASSADEPFRLTPHAEREADALRRVLRSALVPTGTAPQRVAILDSGLSPEYTAHRNIHYIDYSAPGSHRLNRPLADPIGHGTRVAAILDKILPQDVEMSIGRLPSEAGSLTALTIAHALGDIVARERPEVVNLSVCPRSDWFVCPACRQRVSSPTFFSALLPLVIRMAGQSTESTVTVMAAGNAGMTPNSRWLTEGVSTLVLAVAENRNGDRARYSSAPEGPNADLFSAGAFGGDDPDDPEAQGVFYDGTHGTSFAAPFISAAALLAKRFGSPLLHNHHTQIGLFIRNLIAGARAGQSLRLIASSSESD